MPIRHISTCLDSAGVEFQEDGVVFVTTEPVILGVCDAFSIPYDRDTPPIFVPDGNWKKISTGEMVKLIFCQTLPEVQKNDFWATISEIDKKVRELNIRAQDQYNLPREPAYSAGMSCVAVRVWPGTIEIFQCGDCIAAWKYKNGEIDYTRNPVKAASIRLRKAKAQLLKESDGDVDKARVRFTPLLQEQKNSDTNNEQSSEGYPSINGSLRIQMCQEVSLPSNEISCLLLCSDGFLPFECFNDQERINKLIRNIDCAGLDGHLERILKLQGEEATAAFIRFE